MRLPFLFFMVFGLSINFSLQFSPQNSPSLTWESLGTDLETGSTPNEGSTNGGWDDSGDDDVKIFDFLSSRSSSSSSSSISTTTHTSVPSITNTTTVAVPTTSIKSIFPKEERLSFNSAFDIDLEGGDAEEGDIVGSGNGGLTDNTDSNIGGVLPREDSTTISTSTTSITSTTSTTSTTSVTSATSTTSHADLNPSFPPIHSTEFVSKNKGRITQCQVQRDSGSFPISYRPECTGDGKFRPVQCRASQCFCVDVETGVQSSSSHDMNDANVNSLICSNSSEPFPNTDDEDIGAEAGSGDRAVAALPRPNGKKGKFDFGDLSPDTHGFDGSVDVSGRLPIFPIHVDVHKNSFSATPDINRPFPESADVFPGKDDIFPPRNTWKAHVPSATPTVSISGDLPIDKNVQDPTFKDPLEPESSKPTNDFSKVTKKRVSVPLFDNPKLLGGLIGGAVATLLLLILVVFFALYRMRKKDEGSYPLDEQQKQPLHPYQRCPDKEFYA